MRFPTALRHRRYRLLWIGLIISVTGTRMQAAAVLWHVHEINGQPIALGGVGAGDGIILHEFGWIRSGTIQTPLGSPIRPV